MTIPTSYHSNVSVGGSISIIDTRIKSIKTNNENCIKISGKTVSFIERGAGCIIIQLISGQIITRGFFIDYNNENLLNIGSEYTGNNKIWYDNYNDCLYKTFNIDYSETDVFIFVNETKSLGMTPVFIYKNNIYYNDNEYMLNYIKKTIKLMKLAEDCIFIYEPELLSYDRFAIDLVVDSQDGLCDLEFFLKNIILKDPPVCKFVLCLEAPRIPECNFNEMNDYMQYKALEDSTVLNIFETSPYVAFVVKEDMKTTDDWLTFMLYTKKVLDYTSKRGILIYTPVGHINETLEISKKTNRLYQNHTNTYSDYENISIPFIFGGNFAYNVNDNLWDDPNVIGDSIILPHTNMLKSSNVFMILFGNKSEGYNSHIPHPSTGWKITDHHYTLSKIKNFLLIR